MAEACTYQGGCHCGSVRFQVTIERYEAIDCNCSICRKKGFLHLILPPERFQLLQGEESLAEYQFNTGTARHLFCSVCGIHSFYHPRSHPEHIDVNLHCLDVWMDSSFINLFDVQSFDGQNWEETIKTLNESV